MYLSFIDYCGHEIPAVFVVVTKTVDFMGYRVSTGYNMKVFNEFLMEFLETLNLRPHKTTQKVKNFFVKPN